MNSQDTHVELGVKVHSYMSSDDVDAKQATLSSRDVKLRDEECLQNWGNANLLN